MQTNSINLLRARTVLTPEFLEWEAKLKKISLYLLTLFVLAGLIIGSAYFYVSQQNNALLSEKKKLSSQLVQDTQKIAYYAAIKNRAALIAKILADQRNFVRVLEVSQQLLPPDLTSTITLDKEAKVSLSIDASHIEETFIVISSLIKLLQEKVIKRPTLESLTFDLKNGVSLILSYQLTSQ